MIVTKEWLKEWVDIGDISTEKLCEVLNEIGLEVDSVTEYKIPDKVVVGKVLKCEKHPDADKLSVCQVDTGEETLQIVCGAKNVAKGQLVPVATVGAKLSENFTIKKAKLRGVESNGMICSSEELGLPKLNDGIWVLDKSLGDLQIGKELKEYPLINDTVIDIELTANRGDCLSIHGVARDLSAALDVPLKERIFKIEENAKGVGRVIKFEKEDKIDSYILYRYFIKESLTVPALIELRLGWIGEKRESKIEKFITYAIHSTGVLIRCYNTDLFEKDINGTYHIHIKKDKNSLDVVANNENIISVIGVYQDENYKPKDGDKNLLVEGSYIDPDLISSRVANLDIKKDEYYFYRSSRGSEPDLQFGLNYFLYLIEQYGEVELYSGVQKLIHNFENENIVLDFEKIFSFLGEEIPKEKILKILRKLGFSINSQRASQRVIVSAPLFRADIKNEQDVIEEILRIYGINNIDSKPYISYERNVFNDSYFKYQKKRAYRNKAADEGFFESIHYAFSHKEKLEKYGFETVDEEKEILNPITNEMNTLRTTLLINMLESAARNIKNSKKRVALFEIGTVFDKNRNEKESFALLFSGERERAFVTNHGKPPMIDFFSFAKKVADILGDMEIKSASTDNSLFNPYEFGEVFIDGKKVGFIARVSLEAEKEFDLMKTYVCELDFDALPQLLPYKENPVKIYSKFQPISRDLSILIDKEIKFENIKEFLAENLPKEVKEFYPIDIYESKELGDKISLTLRFEMQSDEKTLTEEDISKNIDVILEKLKEKFGATIR